VPFGLATTTGGQLAATEPPLVPRKPAGRAGQLELPGLR
jgi:hypothetical protein